MQAIEDILIPHLSAYWKHLQTYLEDPVSSPAKVDAYKVYGAIMVRKHRCYFDPQIGLCVLDILLGNI